MQLGTGELTQGFGFMFEGFAQTAAFVSSVFVKAVLVALWVDHTHPTDTPTEVMAFMWSLFCDHLMNACLCFLYVWFLETWMFNKYFTIFNIRLLFGARQVSRFHILKIDGA